MQKENWIDEIMAVKIDSVKMNQTLVFQTIQHKANEFINSEKQLKQWFVAAVVLMIGINISWIMLAEKTQRHKNHNSSYELMAKEMGISNDYNY